jgi:tRNA pseudouridine38-40 synthase
LDIKEIPQLLVPLERKHIPIVAPAQGLTLTYVHYGGESPWEVYPELDCAVFWNNPETYKRCR